MTLDILRAIGLCLTLTLSVPLQAESGSSDDAPPRKAIATQADYTKCVMNRRGYKAEKLLQAVPGSEKESQIFVELLIPRCLDQGELRMPSGSLRGAVVEALFHRDFDGLFGKQRRSPLAIFEPVTVEKMRELEERDLSRLYGLSIALCAANRQPSVVSEMLDTQPASEAEQIKLTELIPDLQACVPAGQTLEFSSVMLRGLLAESAYRLSVHGQGSTNLALAILPAEPAGAS